MEKKQVKKRYQTPEGEELILASQIDNLLKSGFVITADESSSETVFKKCQQVNELDNTFTVYHLMNTIKGLINELRVSSYRTANIADIIIPKERNKKEDSSEKLRSDTICDNLEDIKFQLIDISTTFLQELNTIEQYIGKQ